MAGALLCAQDTDSCAAGQRWREGRRSAVRRQYAPAAAASSYSGLAAFPLPRPREPGSRPGSARIRPRNAKPLVPTKAAGQPPRTETGKPWQVLN
jgi:hypothetical protein